MGSTASDSILPVLLPAPLRVGSAALEQVLGLPQIVELHRELQDMGDARPLADRLLQRLAITCQVAERDLEKIPAQGPAIVVANHPFGLLDAAALASLLLRVRPDVKFVANRALLLVPEIRDLLIPVTITGRRAVVANSAGLRTALEFVCGGGLLVVFPAGEVSRFRVRQRRVSDAVWQPAVSRLVELVARRGTQVTIVPAFLPGRNSLLFQTLGQVHPAVRTALLPRELLNKRKAAVEIRIGAALPSEALLALPDHEARMRHLRWRCELLAQRAGRLVRKGRRAAGIVPPVAASALARDVARLAPERLLVESGGLQVYLARASELPAVLPEIGRLREMAFRAVGEGTRKACDLDEFDEHYQHLFVWNGNTREVIGAYRLKATDEAASPAQLYTARLFRYGGEFLRRLGPALELGRSFVRLEYQRNFLPLLLLWKGIGQFVARHPQYRRLFGPVSISERYQAASQRLMVSYLQRQAAWPEFAELVRGGYDGRAADVTELPRDLDDLAALVSDVEPQRQGIPVLLRQYLKLGGKILGFHVDADFTNVLDGLMLVDLTRTDAALLSRYLGKAGAQQFLSFHSGGVYEAH